MLSARKIVSSPAQAPPRIKCGEVLSISGDRLLATAMSKEIEKEKARWLENRQATSIFEAKIRLFLLISRPPNVSWLELPAAWRGNDCRVMALSGSDINIAQG